MSTVIIFATILFNGIVENLEYKVGTFSSYEECTKYISDNQEHIGSTLRQHLDKVYPNSEILIISCSDRINFVSDDETV